MTKKYILNIKAIITILITFTLLGCNTTIDSIDLSETPVTPKQVNETIKNNSVKDSLKGVTLRVATSGLLAPFSYYDEVDGTLIGFDLDLLNALQELLGFDIENEIQAMDYTTLTSSIANNNYDFAIAALSATDSRKAVMHFSKTYYESGQILVINKDSSPKEISDIDDFKENKYKLGIEKSTNSHSYCIANGIPASSLELHNEITTVYEALEQGRIDACIQDTPGIAYYIKTNPDTKLAMLGREFNQGQAKYAIALSFEFCKQNPHIPIILNTAIDELEENGTIAKIINTWCK